MDPVLKRMALNARIDRQRALNPPSSAGPIHPETALEMQIVNAGMQQVITSKDAVAAARLAGSAHPEDIDEQLASWL
jgi:hypothetical protein